MSAEFDLSRVRTVDLEFVDVALISRTNSTLDSGVVQGIVAEGIDPDKFGALPAYFDGMRWTITDGNHRLAAACILGVQFVPVVRLTLEEYSFIAFSKTKTVDLLIRVPDRPRYHTRVNAPMMRSSRSRNDR